MNTNKSLFPLLCSLMLLASCSDAEPNEPNNPPKPPVTEPDDTAFTAIPSGEKVGAFNMPYVRYESSMAALSDGAVARQDRTFNIDNLAAHASHQEYVELGRAGAKASWQVTEAANGVTLRFTLPDSADGNGTTSVVELMRGDEVLKEIELSSYWSYQYFVQTPADQRGYGKNKPITGSRALMCFDETHTLLAESLELGDTFSVRLKSGEVTGVDFVELEPVGAPIAAPAGAINVTEAAYGAIPGDNTDDYAAISAAIKAAAPGQTVYIPEGKYILTQALPLTRGVKILGAGMWYTDLFFTVDEAYKYSTGFAQYEADDIYIGHLYINTDNNRRTISDDNTKYRSNRLFSGTWTNSKVEYVWGEHTTCGIWFGDYRSNDPSFSQNVTFSNVRVRNTYADGVNFAQGSSNCTFEHGSVRNCGDDGLASFSSYKTATNLPEANHGNIFQYCTVEFVWRASSVGIFGGHGHTIRNLLIKDAIGSSGIRFNTVFEAKLFSSEHPMEVSNCVIERCGSRYTTFNSMVPAVYIEQADEAIEGIHFTNIDIRESLTHGIEVVGHDVTDVVFENIVIDQVGKDGGTGEYTGYGILLDANTKDSSKLNTDVTLTKIRFAGCDNGKFINVNNMYNVTINQ